MSKRYFLFVLTLLLTSCASPIALSDMKTLPQGEALIFGRMKVIEFGVRTEGWGSRLHILPDADSEPVRHVLTGDGSFYWHLPPGGYTITDFQMRRGFPVIISLRPIFAQFMVPEATSLVYIGTLTINLPSGLVPMRIEDEYGQASQRLKSKFPKIQGEATKSLMHLEKAR